MKTLLIAAFAALMMIIAPAAQAADAKINIAVVDIQSLLKSSKAAQNIESQIATMRKSFQNEVEAEEKNLREKEKAIIAQKATLKEDELKVKAEEFQKQVSAGQKKIQDRKAALDKTINAALAKLRAEIVKIVADIGSKKDLDLVLARTDVVIVDKELDITADVLKALDEQLPSVKIQ
jgi:outer membrane protein